MSQFKIEFGRYKKAYNSLILPFRVCMRIDLLWIDFFLSQNNDKNYNDDNGKKYEYFIRKGLEMDVFGHKYIVYSCIDFKLFPTKTDIQQ